MSGQQDWKFSVSSFPFYLKQILKMGILTLMPFGGLQDETLHINKNEIFIQNKSLLFSLHETHELKSFHSTVSWISVFLFLSCTMQKAVVKIGLISCRVLCSSTQSW